MGGRLLTLLAWSGHIHIKLLTNKNNLTCIYIIYTYTHHFPYVQFGLALNMCSTMLHLPHHPHLFSTHRCVHFLVELSSPYRWVSHSINVFILTTAIEEKVHVFTYYKQETWTLSFAFYNSTVCLHYYTVINVFKVLLSWNSLQLAVLNILRIKFAGIKSNS